MCKVSFIVPVYNSEKYLRKCLDSLVNQTLEDIEIIIINDGSVDSSQNIIDEYVQKYPYKIKCFYQQNSGQAAARNNGIKRANGVFISFIDSDDYLEPKALEVAYRYAVEKKVDILCFNFFEELENGDKKESSYYTFNDFPNDIKYILNETSVWNKIIKRDLLINNDLYFLEDYIYEDLEFIPKLILYTDKIDFINDKLYHYVIHENSTMRQKEYNTKLESIYYVMESLKKNFENTKYKDEVEYLYVEHLLHGAVLRYLNYEEGNEDINRIANIMKQCFPKWNKNKYYKKENIKYKIVCMLAYNKKINVLKKILKK